MADRRQRWWNSLAFESSFKKRQIMRVLAFALAYVAISTLCMGFAYETVLRPLSRGEMPLVLKLHILRDTGGVPGIREMLLIWGTMMTSLSVVFAVAVGMHFSHKLAGPLHRFKLELKRLAEGAAAGPVRLRQGDDDFLEMADALNGALERLQRDSLLARQEVERSEARLAELCEGVQRHVGDPEALRRLVEKVSQPD